MSDQARALATHGTYEVVHDPARADYPFEVYDHEGSLWERYATRAEAEAEAASQARADRVAELKDRIEDRLHECDDLDTLERIAGWLPQ